MGLIERPIDYDAVSEQIDYEFLGKEKIYSDINEVLDEYACIYYNQKFNEIGESKYYDYPRLFRIYDKEDIDYYEVVFDTNIDIELDFSRGRLYMTVGSEIDSFDVRGWIYNELTEEYIDKYDVLIKFKDEFDGNMLYFYWLETDDYGYSDH